MKPEGSVNLVQLQLAICTWDNSNFSPLCAWRTAKVLWVFILGLLTCFSENVNSQIIGSTNGMESANNCILCYLFKSYRNNSVYVTDCYWVGQKTLELLVSPRGRVDCKVLLVIISQHFSSTFCQNCFFFFFRNSLWHNDTGAWWHSQYYMSKNWIQCNTWIQTKG